ncbi:hypothetical protein ACWGQ9_02345 [Streptomyces parvus]
MNGNSRHKGECALKEIQVFVPIDPAAPDAGAFLLSSPDPGAP